MKVKVYVSDDKKVVAGPITGIRKVERTKGGYILHFADYDHAYRAAKVLMNNHETVHILGKEYFL